LEASGRLILADPIRSVLICRCFGRRRNLFAKTNRQTFGQAMHKLGASPLTGAEKQRRHRERTKARLAEADRLKSLVAGDDGAGFPGLSALYNSLLTGLGASADEREALNAGVGAIATDLHAALAARAGEDLAQLREDKRRRRTSLLARLDGPSRIKG
jgi:hypothetical protein